MFSWSKTQEWNKPNNIIILANSYPSGGGNF